MSATQITHNTSPSTEKLSWHGLLDAAMAVSDRHGLPRRLDRFPNHAETLELVAAFPNVRFFVMVGAA
jgi:hypothetical protein